MDALPVAVVAALLLELRVARHRGADRLRVGAVVAVARLLDLELEPADQRVLVLLVLVAVPGLVCGIRAHGALLTGSSGATVPWEAMDAFGPHARSPAELAATRRLRGSGTPFLELRDAAGRQRLVRLPSDRISIGRAEGCGVALPWDAEVSRLHAV